MSERRTRGHASHAGGVAAETAACAALVADGWAIVLRRARTPAGEIDLVARQGGMIAFVEVKARATLGEAAHALGAPQSRRLTATATALMAEHPEWAGCDFRFDVLLVDRLGRVRRIADAIRASEAGI